MEESTQNINIGTVFEKIAGCKAPCSFGEPFATAFSRFYQGNPEDVAVAAYTCSLFLSAILEGFPTGLLHTFVHATQETHSRIPFNCDMYGNIFAQMEKERRECVVLLNAGKQAVTHACSKEEIFEAFDFYTNR